MSRFRLEEPARPEHTSLLLSELDARGWTRTLDHEWSLNWTFGLHQANEYAAARSDQRLNHFPGIVTQHSKDELAFFLERARQRAGSDFGFSPRTFSMPHQFEAWQAAAATDPTAIWIRKPKRGAKGFGVQVITDVSAEVADPTCIIQRYIENPLVVPEYPHKHIIRVYVAVTSLDPLIAYVHPRTFVRFTSRPFGLSPDELADPIRHITNPSVQLTNPELDGGIRIMEWTEFQGLLQRAGHVPTSLWARIRTMLARTLAAHRRPMQTVTERYMPSAAPCFELLGYDVMFNDQMEPCLIECNMSPLLSVRGEPGSKDRATHESVKRPVISDVLNLAGITANAALDGCQPVARFQDDHARRGEFALLGPADGLIDVLQAVDELTELDQQLWSSLDASASH